MMGNMLVCRAGLLGALTASSLVVGCAADPPTPGGEPADGAPAARDPELQARVDEVLASIPGGRQVSATEVDYPGLTVTVDPAFSAASPAASLQASSIACASGHFCINVRGTAFDFYTCTMWDLSNWFGLSPFNNNQTNHAVARAYNQSWVEVFTNTAVSSGSVDVGPWYHFKPC